MDSEQWTRAWRNFAGSGWQREINVRDFIVSNVTPYTGGPEFLAKPTHGHSPSGQASARLPRRGQEGGA